MQPISFGMRIGIDSDVREGPDRMHAIASHCNDKRSASKRVQELSTELFFSIFIRVKSSFSSYMYQPHLYRNAGHLLKRVW